MKNGISFGVVLLFLVVSVGQVFSEPVTVFEPEVFTREAGKPTTQSRSFPVEDGVTDCLVWVTDENGGEPRNVEVLINGEIILSKNDVKNPVNSPLDLPLQPQNTLEVTQYGKPGSKVLVEIVGQKEEQEDEGEPIRIGI